MKINTNTWNKIRYSLYSPGYNLVAGVLRKSRKESIASLTILPGDSVLLVGAGTGLDLDFLPDNIQITAVDITPSMINRLKHRSIKLRKPVSALVMDGQALEFPEESFNCVILHLILAVIPDPVQCLKEAERVLRKEGQMVVYDKFIPKNMSASKTRRILNLFTNTFFSDITRDFESLVDQTDLLVISDRKGELNGNFRLIKLIKK